MLSSSANEIDTLTSYCKATADRLRLLILRVLAKESFSVLELCQILDVAQPALSHHLKILSAACLVDTRRQGTSIFYRRAVIGSIDPIRDLRQSLMDSVDSILLRQQILVAIEQVHSARKNQAKQFFEKNFDRFKDNQNLIAEYDNYASCITDLLDNTTMGITGPVIETAQVTAP